MRENHSHRLGRVVWWSALYDLVLTLPFAFPWSANLMIDLLREAHDRLDLPGQFPAFEPLHMFFVNLFGTIVTLWAVLRLRDPQPGYGLADSAGRLFFSTWMATYFWGYGSTALLAVYLLPEVIWASVQSSAWWKWYVRVYRVVRQPAMAGAREG